MMVRKAFTLVEMVVGITIAAILAFAFYVTFGTGASTTSAADDRAQRAREASSALYEIASAIAALETTNPPESFLQTVGAYPNTLSQLTTQITTADRNSCDRVTTDNYSGAAIPAGGPVNPGYVLGWKGPYYTITFGAGANTQLAKGFVVQDDMIRAPANPPNNPKSDEWAGRLRMRMNGVSQADAQALDAEVDQTLNGAAGTVRYTASDPTTVDYEIVVSRC